MSEVSLLASLDALTWALIIMVGVPVLLLVYAHLKIYQQYSKCKQIPGTYQFSFSPFRIPYFAPYLYFGNEGILMDLLEKFGDKENKTMRVTLMERSTVWISDPAMLKEYFLTKANNFYKPEKIYDMFNIFGENILSAKNSDAWKRHHRVCSPAFSTANLQYMCEVAANSSDLLFRKWNALIEKHDSYVLEEGDFSDVTADVIGKAGFNIDFAIFSEDEEGRKFRHSMEVVINKAIVLRRFISHLPLIHDTLAWFMGVDKAVEHCSNKLDEIIAERTKTIQKRVENSIANDQEEERMRDILSLLVEANCVEKVLSNQELKSNALIMVLAGHETTSTALQWIIYELSKHPEIQQKVYDEIERVLGGRAPTYDDVPSLTYTNAVIMETLRYHPPVITVIKNVCKKATKIGPYEIPKGSNVNGLITGVHHLDRNWPNANKYDPERFMDAEFRESVQHDFTWIPFSAGNRKCIGYKFALLEACVILTKMIQSYQFTLLNDESVDPVKARPGITSRPSQNLKVKVTKRIQ